MFDESDLQKQVDALSDFQYRHSTITERIETTYRLGNALTEYLEKQVILDYHFRGMQEQLENEHPHLVEKAKKMLGHTLYYDLSPMSRPIPKDHYLYGQLMEHYTKLRTTFQSDKLFASIGQWTAEAVT